MTKDSIQRLSARFPECRETLDFIYRLRDLTRQPPFLEFVEHVAAIEFEDGKVNLALLTPDLLATWITHMSHGTRVRMQALEDGILAGLADGQLLAPSVLTRCHLEVAGLAAQANWALIRFSQTGDQEPLKKYILQSAYSSAMVSKKPDLITKEAIPGVFSEPNNVMNAIDALQKFFDAITATPLFKLRSLYDQLCDFTHPGILGVRSFVEVHGKHPDGRRLQYTRKETLEAGDVYNLLTALLWSMRGGHTCAALMYCGEIIVEDGGLRYEKPDRESGDAIRQQFLQHSPP